MPHFSRTIFSIIVLLLVLDCFVWYGIWMIFSPSAQYPWHFLSVGQGDATLFVSPRGNFKMLTDGGPDGAILLAQLSRVISPFDRRIDLLVVSHPQLDHFNGLRSVLRDYSVGALITNGRSSDQPGGAWDDLLRLAKDSNVPVISIGVGTTVRYRDVLLRVLSPDSSYIQSAELNDTGIVEKITCERCPSVLLTADIDGPLERVLAGAADLHADILKIAHHGSAFSTTPEFLRAVAPRVAIIEVGLGNNYHHPASSTLLRLEGAQIPVFRTDRDGTVDVGLSGATLLISPAR